MILLAETIAFSHSQVQVLKSPVQSKSKHTLLILFHASPVSQFRLTVKFHNKVWWAQHGLSYIFLRLTLLILPPCPCVAFVLFRIRVENKQKGERQNPVWLMLLNSGSLPSLQQIPRGRLFYGDIQRPTPILSVLYSLTQEGCSQTDFLRLLLSCCSSGLPHKGFVFWGLLALPCGCLEWGPFKMAHHGHWNSCSLVRPPAKVQIAPIEEFISVLGAAPVTSLCTSLCTIPDFKGRKPSCPKNSFYQVLLQ